MHAVTIFTPRDYPGYKAW